MAERTECVPLIKWAGGKRQLAEELRKRIPNKFGTYYEPFFGGGAVFFDLNPEKAVINDSNPQLMNLYRQTALDTDGLAYLMDSYQGKYNLAPDMFRKDEVYYECRRKFNECILKNELSTESAALFVFLNKTAFNGVYRENSKGLFNVPSSHRKTTTLYNRGNLEKASERLKKAKIMTGDFELAVSEAEKGDFVFFDSPYYDTFDSYQAGGFSIDDHRRLAVLFRKLSEKGVFCVLTNSSSDFIRNLYRDFRIDSVKVKRMVNRNASERTGEEIIVSNFG